ncbi:Phosphate metabolism transcription protein [Scheffersomyces spartinae]|uniref:Phosphate metabolism transcription protein n=1 Tax=Scheffersomyces spartinae TaxID=45513 RepID=A0A9P7VA74_9ASCO|nr:Phosphate metabolism transcription protein [Scheffersomyces spartinae]KAG7194137.1 Phosphate metabolism transcription protein [Scheffersomyces spartinae]
MSTAPENQDTPRIMLFGNKMDQEIYTPWKQYYMNYTHLKKLLKEGVILKDNWLDKDEQLFVAALDEDLEKVYTFQHEKYDELSAELDDLQLLTTKQTSGFDVLAFSKELDEVLSMTRELDHFQRLNYTGFTKIVKKHDRLHPQFSVQPLLNVRLKKLPFHLEDYSPLLYKVSALFQFLRDNYDVDQSLSKLSSFNDETIQDYQSFKFWIHPDNLMEVKTTILRHLPVLVYDQSHGNGRGAENQDGDIDDDDDDDDDDDNPVINCLYFDSPNFDMYNHKLVKSPNSSTLRIKWVGKLSERPKITVEKKNFDVTHDDFNIDERVQIKEKYLNDFVHGLFVPLKKLEAKLQRNGSLDTIGKLQLFIKDNHLQPAIRTMYKRQAFQIPGDDRIRIVIDSNLLFVREDSFDESRPIRDPSNWHRIDIDLNPQNQHAYLRSGEFSKFPYSVMEIKIKSAKRKSLHWVDELVHDTSLVTEVPNFSKFIQGVASLFLEDDKLDNIPLWFNELNSLQDQVKLALTIDPKQQIAQNKLKLEKVQNDEENLAKFKSLLNNTKDNFQPRSKSFSLSSPLLVGDRTVSNSTVPKIQEVDESGLASSTSPTKRDIVSVSLLDRSNLTASFNGGMQVAGPSGEGARDLDDGDSSEDYEDDDDISDSHAPGALSKLLRFPTTLSKLIDVDSEEEEEPDLPMGVTKPEGYIKNAGPLRIEPKVWLANERTFNRWLHVTTLLSSLTFIIYSLANKANSFELSETLAYIYFGLTLFSGVWGYYVFMKRRDIIMERSGKHLDNVFGPLVVAVGLIGGLIINFVFGWKKIAQAAAMANGTAAMATLGNHTNGDFAQAVTRDFYAQNPFHKAIHEFIFSWVA